MFKYLIVLVLTIIIPNLAFAAEPQTGHCPEVGPDLGYPEGLQWTVEDYLGKGSLVCLNIVAHCTEVAQYDAQGFLIAAKNTDPDPMSGWLIKRNPVGKTWTIEAYTREGARINESHAICTQEMGPEIEQ